MTEQPGGGVDGERLARLERDQLEDGRDPITDLEVVEPVDELSRALPAEVVDPVVAVGRDPQLAQSPDTISADARR